MQVLFLFFTDPPKPFSSSVAALSAVVRNAGHTPLALEIPRRGSIDAVVREVEAREADVIAVSAMSRDWPGAWALLERLQTTAFVVVGGYHATLAPHDVARCDRVDGIAIGEGERPLARLLEQLDAGAVTTGPGMWVRRHDAFTDALPSADPELDIAALPAWDYEVFGGPSRGLNTFGPVVDGYLPTRASRGCPFSCAYCSAPTWGKVMGFDRKAMRNVRPVDHLIAEHVELASRHTLEGFEFWDEHFPVSLPWLRELAREYPRRVGLPFKVEMHPNAATRERLGLLAEAGCALFHCGVEAGDETLRRETLNRRTDDATLQRVFDDARALGLETSASLMTQLPGETRAQASATMGLLRAVRPGSFMWSTYQPLPATPLGDAAMPQWPGPARERFDDYDEAVSRTPAMQTSAERAQTFAELGVLQAELVTAAGGTPRPVDVPAADSAPEALVRLLGRAVEAARWEDDALQLWLPEGRVEVRARVEGQRAYVTTDHLAISHRGRDASPSLRAVLDALALRLEDVRWSELRGACPG